MTVERDEFEQLRRDIFARVNKLETEVRLLVQALGTHKDRAEEKFGYNGTAHTEIRKELEDIEKELKDVIRPATAWVLGIRRAWSKIIIALIIMGIVAVGTALMKVYTFLQSLPGGGTQ